MASGNENPMYGGITQLFITKLIPNRVAEVADQLIPNEIFYKANDVSLAEVSLNDDVRNFKRVI